MKFRLARRLLYFISFAKGLQLSKLVSRYVFFYFGKSEIEKRDWEEAVLVSFFFLDFFANPLAD